MLIISTFPIYAIVENAIFVRAFSYTAWCCIILTHHYSLISSYCVIQFLYITKRLPENIPFNLLRITFEPVTDILYPKANNKSIGITNFSDWIALTHGRVKKVFKQPIMCIVYLPRVMYIWMKQTNIYFVWMIIYSICI